MLSEQPHQMKLASTHPSGAEEWVCPDCGRRFVAQWEPKFRRVILNPGQTEIAHVGQTMNLLFEAENVTGEDTSTVEPGLQDVWKDWLDKLDFDPDDDRD
jgi:hypothetical protein